MQATRAHDAARSDGDAPAAREGSTPTRSRFGRRLAIIAVVALGVRVAAALFYDNHRGLWGDSYWYSGVANLLADGHGFVQPIARVAYGQDWPTAAHPPLYALYLSIVGHVDQSVVAQRLWSTLPGVGTVVVLGILMRDLVGERAGLLAAAVGAVFVDLVAQDVLVMSEGLYALTIIVTVYAAYRFLRRPDLRHAGYLGGAIALAALTRAEGVLLLLILLVPLALRARDLSVRRRFACIGVGAVVAAVLIAPWFVYNNVDRFDRPVWLSTGLGGLVGSSNCKPAYNGPGIGGWGGVCARHVKVTVREDETVQDQKLLDAGLDYASNHADRLPAVIPIRLLRTFGFYKPFDVTAGDILLKDGNARLLTWLAMIQYWCLLPLAIAGMVMLRRRGIALLPFLAPIATVVVITVLGYGTMRFRVAFDVVLPATGAVALDALWRRVEAHRRAPRERRTGVPATLT
jgi:4-amino-4-deoxy-L-arabinose transferase-like glycosyltransferase